MITPICTMRTLMAAAEDIGAIDACRLVAIDEIVLAFERLR
ncbi:hypothetical protein [Cupriavidus consociatus]|nr:MULTISPECIES: hypothetical protein [unclassified Cupriavidus]MDK2661795.1 hypothetical protein [Cupriavidus sp. LEh21]